MKAKFLTCLVLSIGLHLLCLAPLFVLGAPSPPPQAETIDVRLVEKMPRTKITPQKPTEITKDKRRTPPTQASSVPQTVQPPNPVPEDAPEPEGVSFETEGKVNIGYMQRLKAKIFRVWQYPQTAIAAGHQGMVKIAFIVDGGGRLIGVELLTSSGHRELDRAVLDAVRDASPFGRFTPDIQQETLKIKGRFRYVID